MPGKKKPTMSDKEILRIANEIANPHGLKAEFLEDAFSVGVGGDERSYTRATCLVGEMPEDSVLRTISSAITNRTPVNRVTIELARRQPPTAKKKKK